MQLINFINNFYKQYQIPLDPVYTGKMLFAIFDMIKNKKWRWGKNILAIHTGGIQGVVGMNRQLQKKHSPLIIFEKITLNCSIDAFFLVGSAEKLLCEKESRRTKIEAVEN